MAISRVPVLSVSPARPVPSLRSGTKNVVGPFRRWQPATAQRCSDGRKSRNTGTTPSWLLTLTHGSVKLSIKSMRSGSTRRYRNMPVIDLTFDLGGSVRQGLAKDPAAAESGSPVITGRALNRTGRSGGSPGRNERAPRARQRINRERRLPRSRTSTPCSAPSRRRLRAGATHVQMTYVAPKKR